MVRQAYPGADILEIPYTAEGITKIRNGDCGGMVDSAQAAMYQTIQQGNCDMCEVGPRFMLQNMIYGVGKSGNADQQVINYWLAVLRETGWIRALESEFFVHGSACGAQPTTDAKDYVIDVDAMLGIFLLLMAVSAGIVGTFVFHVMQHKAFLRLVFARIDQDKTGTLTEIEIKRLLVVMGLTPEATPEDPKTLQEHMDEMTSFTPEPGVRFKEFSMWWEAQPYYVRQNIFSAWSRKEHSQREHEHDLIDNPMDQSDSDGTDDDSYGTKNGVLDLGVGSNLTNILQAAEA
jgi:hypothetical protein